MLRTTAPCIRRDVFDLDGTALSKEFAIIATSRAADRLNAADIDRHTRGHWGIENLEHRCRDTVWDEDANQATAGGGPRVMATLRNLALSLLRRTGVTEITRTVQPIGRDRMRALHLIATYSHGYRSRTDIEMAVGRTSTSSTLPATLTGTAVSVEQASPARSA
jgi:hypothetical protein